MNDTDDFFSPPPFDADASLKNLLRSLRDLQVLKERGNQFELRSQSVVELSIDSDTVRSRLARRPARTPDWDEQILKSSADVRKFMEEVKRRLAKWEEE